MTFMKHLAVLLVAALLSACATGPRTVDISHEQLQAALSRNFPVEQRQLELVDLQATGPTLTLLPESNRLRLDMAMSGKLRVLPNALYGNLTMSFMPRFEGSDATIRMADVRIERFDLQGLPQPLRAQLVRLGPPFVEKILEGSPLHRFRADDIARAQGWVPGEIRVTSSGLRVTLLPPVR